MWKGRFSEDTAEVVLKFTQSLDMDWQLAEADIRGSKAHVRTLASAGLISAEEEGALIRGLDQVLEEVKSGKLKPQIELEDVHMNVEARLTELLGDVGKKLHTGRSRNDQIATTLRLFLRDQLIQIGSKLKAFLEALLDRAESHIDFVVPGYTHLRRAQPISMGHYWMSHFWAFNRDFLRLKAAFEALSECPLGSAALAGSTLPLDRKLPAKLLRFCKPTENSIDSVASRDYLADFHHFASLFAVHCSRLAEDLIIYNSDEFGILDLPDAFCTGSSIMPQKKNPDVLELVRGKTGQILAGYVDLAVTLKGIPLAYDRDLQEDKRGLMRTLQTLHGMLDVLTPLILRVEVNAKGASKAFDDGFIFATDVAEYLVLKGIPFRMAHELVGKAVKWCLSKNKGFSDLSLEEWRNLIPHIDEEMIANLNPRSSVERRNTYGGTSFAEVRRQIKEGKKLVEDAEKFLSTWVGDVDYSCDL